jgi:hypothetical protein
VEGCSFGSYSFNAVGTGGGVSFDVLTTAGFFRSPFSGAGVFDGAWHHIAGTYDGMTVRLYVDGMEVGSGTPASGSIRYGLSTSNDLTFGRYDNTGCGFNYSYGGLLDEVEIFNRALSAAEIQTLVGAGSSGKCKCEAIICPPNQTTVAPTPTSTGAVVNFPEPTPQGSCGVITCTPPSGSTFPIGTTTVTCTSTAGPSCSFTVTVYSTCIQDVQTGDTLRVNYQTGEYIYCRKSNGMTLAGTGMVQTNQACYFELRHQTQTRNVHVRIFKCANNGQAQLSASGMGPASLFDSNLSDNACLCP